MIRRLEPGEEEEVCKLIQDVFVEFVAPLYEKEGVDDFLHYVDPKVMAERSRSNHFTLLAEDSGNLVGVIEMRGFNHVSLLFVAREAQRRGIARKLLNEGLKISRRNRPDLPEVSRHQARRGAEHDGVVPALLHRLRDHGNAVVVVEHYLDVIKTADWIVDLGPEGGDGGGQILVAGTPEDVAAHETSHTGRFLARVLARGSKTLEQGDAQYQHMKTERFP